MFSPDFQAVLFKIILEEEGIERKKYLEIDLQDRTISILKATTQKVYLIDITSASQSGACPYWRSLFCSGVTWITGRS